MPRSSRIDAPGAVHHIIARGIEKREIFRDDVDRNDFISRLERILPDAATACYAWALIPNHLHLLLRTGHEPISTVMRRLLTGYAVAFNRRHHRHGKLFQNRYQSILCQEDLYLKELVRYIHLNPLRAKLVRQMDGLDRFSWCGHSALVGTIKRPWQHTDSVLSLFGSTKHVARRCYRQFVENGIEQGQRPELTGGGLIRSFGGWETVKKMRRGKIRLKSDERILGDTDFIKQALKIANENIRQRHQLKARGVDFDTLVATVAEHLKMAPAEVVRNGKQSQKVKARSLLCYLAQRQLGMSTVEISRRLKICQSAVSRLSRRGEEMAKGENPLPFLTNSI